MDPLRDGSIFGPREQALLRASSRKSDEFSRFRRPASIPRPDSDGAPVHATPLRATTPSDVPDGACVLRHWHLKLGNRHPITINNKKSGEAFRVLPVAVEGTRTNPETGADQPWHSSVIVRRVQANQVRTSSGRVYVLDGPMVTADAEGEGFDANVLRAFRRGFPADWMAVLSVVEVEEVVEPPRRKKKRKTSTPVGRTRSGRTVLPPLAYWAHERVQTDGDGNVVGVSPAVDPMPKPKRRAKPKTKPKAKPKARSPPRDDYIDDYIESDHASESDYVAPDDDSDSDYGAQTKAKRKRAPEEGDWTTEQRTALDLAQAELDPRAAAFWDRVALRVSGKTAGECQRRAQAAVPVPRRRRQEEPAEETEGAGELALTSPLAGKGTMKRSKQLRAALKRADAGHADDALAATPYRAAAVSAAAALPAVPATPSTPISTGCVVRARASHSRPRPRGAPRVASPDESPEFLRPVERDQVARYTYQLRKTQRAVVGLHAGGMAARRGGGEAGVAAAMRGVADGTADMMRREEDEDPDEEGDSYFSDGE